MFYCNTKRTNLRIMVCIVLGNWQVGYLVEVKIVGFFMRVGSFLLIFLL
jgi:hypothetical protein